MNRNLSFYWMLSCMIGFSAQLQGQGAPFKDKFRQLEEILPTPTAYRTGSGAPGHEYWQQQADYKMQIGVDDQTQKLSGDETITYTNNSPDVLTYLWLQLDQNNMEKNGFAQKAESTKFADKMTVGQFKRVFPDYDGGFKVETVSDLSNKPLPYTIVETMMRVDLPKPLKKGDKFSFKVKWWFNINDRIKLGGRAGYEYFPEDNNYLYTVAHFFPRMCVYSDVTGWQHKQFLGAGEFTLTFGNYEVALTVPSDHIVGATGVLQNTDACLSAAQKARLEKSKTATEPVLIVTPDEAKAAEGKRASTTKTWVFKAENVRDFAFASSRKFIWDAMGVPQSNGKSVLAMSYYPKEGNPLWERFSTKAVAHTLKWYSHHTFDYPYPVAISVHTDQIGMEYPMICFNGGRPEKDGTYTERTKYGMIGVIIHEVGHNYFPMIVNSDERQWTWMDEGLNSFLETLAEQQWERDFPTRRTTSNVAEYMKGDPARLEPIMTNSESLRQFSNNAYNKTAVSLNILRETILGRELFDFAFKTYANRWMFKHPMPADFFRTMEDASGVDLDWFWRGWYYTTDYVDIAIDKVRVLQLDSKNPTVEAQKRREEAKNAPRSIVSLRNEKEIKQTQDEKDRSLRDYYTDDDPFATNALDKKDYDKYMASLGAEEKALLQNGAKNYYEVTFEMVGDLVMPIIVELEAVDGTKTLHRIPAEIWRKGDKKVTKIFQSDKEIKQIVVDPYLETADTDVSNNYFPPKLQPSRFELFKMRNPETENPMQRAKRAQKE
ncbi:MAG: hypothetical protein RLZZ628_2725 [Bacteroidota bacterium]